MTQGLSESSRAWGPSCKIWHRISKEAISFASRGAFKADSPGVSANGGGDWSLVIRMVPFSLATGSHSNWQRVARSTRRRKPKTFSPVRLAREGRCLSGGDTFERQPQEDRWAHYKLNIKSQREKQPIHSVNKIHTTNKIKTSYKSI